MARYRNSVTNVVVNVDDDTAATLATEWEPAEEPKKAPARKTAKSDES